MDRKISVIEKSKSSNYGVNFKKEKSKKSISDGDFAPKSGKRDTDRKVLSSHAQEIHQTRRPPSRPRPGQKKFLSSILTILSKSTTGTQYPDENERKKHKKTPKFKDTDTKVETMKKDKYKSKILNRNIDNDDNFVILQSKKDIAQTPSNYSEANALGYLQKDRNKLSIKDVINSSNYNDIDKSISSVLKDNAMMKEKMDTFTDDQETLASKIAEGDRKIYNLFVDLLEDTINTCSFKTALSESNTALHIDEAVAKRLLIDDRKTNKLFDATREEVFEKPIDVKLSDHKPVRRKNRVVKPFIPRQNIDIPQVIPNKMKQIKNKKRANLLNVFKMELQNNPMSEPLNLYQALKVLAKCKKIENVNERAKRDFDKCILKRRRIISMKRNKNKPDSDRIVQNFSDYHPKVKKRDNTSVRSNHSLKIFNYNYEDAENEVNRFKYRKMNENQNLGARQCSHQVEREADRSFLLRSNLDYYTLLKYPDCSTCDFTY